MNNTPRIAVLGAARNIEPFVEAVMRNLLMLRHRYTRSEFYLLESDSTDGTLKSLRAWAKAFRGLEVVSMGRLQGRFPLRTERLAHIRNRAYGLVRNKSFDYVIWMDLDDVTANGFPDNLIELVTSAPSDCSFLTATKQAEYYDIWALRHPEICPFDCIAEIRNAGWENKWAHDKFSTEPGRKVLEALKDNRFLQVDSAFGGLGILKNDRDLGPAPFQGLYPDGREVCEWVSFCTKIRETGGAIYIDRDLRIG